MKNFCSTKFTTKRVKGKKKKNPKNSFAKHISVQGNHMQSIVYTEFLKIDGKKDIT